MLGWDGGIRTPECWDQNPVPYHLATSHYDERGAIDDYSIEAASTQGIKDAAEISANFQKQPL